MLKPKDGLQFHGQQKLEMDDIKIEEFFSTSQNQSTSSSQTCTIKPRKIWNQRNNRMACTTCIFVIRWYWGSKVEFEDYGSDCKLVLVG